MLKINDFYTFQPFSNKKQPDVIIRLNTPFPTKDPITMEEWTFDRSREVMNQQAQEIASILMSTLPQGVIDRLVAAMVKEHASDLIINERWPSAENEAD